MSFTLSQVDVAAHAAATLPGYAAVAASQASVLLDAPCTAAIIAAAARTLLRHAVADLTEARHRSSSR